MTPADAAIADLARRALGLVTREQLVALGLTERQRRTAVSSGVLARVAPGVFRHRAWPAGWRQAVLAAVVAAGPGAVAVRACQPRRCGASQGSGAGPSR